MVRVTTYLEDTRDFGRYNKVFGEHFKDAVLARTTVEARAVINTKIEMEAIAYKPNEANERMARSNAKGDADVIRLLGRQTSGNVQKVIFLLEEIGKPYTREDYGRQFNNTHDARIQDAEPERQGADPGRRRHRDLGIEHDPALSRGDAYARAAPARRRPRRTDVERWMDWLLASINAPYLALFRDAKKKPEERARRFRASSASR